MKKIAHITDTFVITNMGRTLVLDSDCSQEVRMGDSILIKANSGSEVATTVFDMIQAIDPKTNLRVSNLLIDDSKANLTNEDVIGAEVFATTT